MNANDFGASELSAPEMSGIDGGNAIWDLAKAVGRALVEGALEELGRMARPTV